MSEVLYKINPNVNYHPIYGKVTKELTYNEKNKGVSLINENELLKLKCDILIGCLDNFSARKFMNDFAVKNSIPYIDGGTSSKSGQLALYVPGKTACLECQIDLSSQLSNAIKKDNDMRNSCPDARHEPSVVMSNEVIGSLIVGETVVISCPDIYGEPIMNRILYRSFHPERIYLSGISKPNEGCLCSKGFYNKHDIQ